MSSVEQTKDIVITKEQAKDGLTILVEKGQKVIVHNWVNKRGTNILFIAPVRGMYKINGDITSVN